MIVTGKLLHVKESNVNEDRSADLLSSRGSLMTSGWLGQRPRLSWSSLENLSLVLLSSPAPLDHSCPRVSSIPPVGAETDVDLSACLDVPHLMNPLLY